VIYITGDTHGILGVYRLDVHHIDGIKAGDYLIVCGDFGLVWNNSKEELQWRDWLDSKPWITLFCDGNHENFDLLSTFPVVEYLGGKCHKISNHIYHLMRGEVFTIEGKTFFVMGGATSVDKENREEYISWWKQEIPSYVETEHGLSVLEEKGNEVDYIITHCLPTSIVQSFFGFSPDYLTDYLEEILQRVKFKKWFCGHYHVELFKDDRFAVLYYSVVRIE
jgi:hypothetical protein